MNFKILNLLGKHFDGEAQKILNKLGRVEYKVMTRKELLLIVDKYDIIVVGVAPHIDKAVLQKAKNLKCVAIPANTLENIDVEYAESKGVKVISLWGERKFLDTITGTAELAAGLMIDVTRLTPWAFDSIRNYEWSREKFRGHNLYGQTLGIVGMGRLGTWMARYGKAFGMEVLFYDPHVGKSRVGGCHKVSFVELLKRSDIVSIHAHLNASTENMFNKSAFSKMKKSAYLINTARGRVVDEGALLKALQKKEIAGYAGDVLADELKFDDEGFINHPMIRHAKKHTNVIVVPHIGGMTHESRSRTDIFTMEKLAAVFGKMKPRKI